jgi:hypothetical protein
MFRTNWKKWAGIGMVSAALLPGVGFAMGAHQIMMNGTQPADAKTSTTDTKNDKKKLTHVVTPSKKLVHRTTTSKKLITRTHPTSKLTTKKVAPTKLTHTSKVTKLTKKPTLAPTKLTSRSSKVIKLTKKTNVTPTKLTSKITRQSTKLTTATHKKLALKSKAKTVNT